MRGGAGPAFLELRTYRYRAHSMYDPERYRTKEEVAESGSERDPIATLGRALEQAGTVTAGDLAAVEAEVDKEIDAAVAFAEAGDLEPVEDLTRFVTTEAGP